MGTYFCFCAGAEKRGCRTNALATCATNFKPKLNQGHHLHFQASRILGTDYGQPQASFCISDTSICKKEIQHIESSAKRGGIFFSATVTGELVAVCTKPDASFCSVSLRPKHLLSTLHRPQRGSCYSGQTPVGKQPKTASTL